MNGPSPALLEARHEISHTPGKPREHQTAIRAIRERVSGALGIAEKDAGRIGVHFAYEPFVDRNGRTVAFEALVR